MSLRNPLILSLLFALAACGFAPIYGSHANNHEVATDLNQVSIENIPERSGQIMRNTLIDLMYGKGRPAAPAYKLIVKLHTSEEDIGIQADATTTRAIMNTTADYTLQDMHGKELTKGTSHSVGSFNTLSQQYGTQSARDDATQRTTNECANQIVSYISLYFAEQAEKEAKISR